MPSNLLLVAPQLPAEGIPGTYLARVGVKVPPFIIAAKNKLLWHIWKGTMLQSSKKPLRGKENISFRKYHNWIAG